MSKYKLACLIACYLWIFIAGFFVGRFFAMGVVV